MTNLVVFRAGIPVAVPAGYASDPAHLELVQRLTSTNAFAEAVAVLEAHPESYLAADILAGVPWARRYLLTLGKEWSNGDRALARRASRALAGVLSGARPRVGRPRSLLTPAQEAAGAAAIVRCRVLVDGLWAGERANLVAAVTKAQALSASHRQALTLLLRRRGVRKAHLVLSLASWETGIPVRRLRQTRAVADLVYG